MRWTDDKGEQRTAHFDRKVDAERHDANVRADLSRGVYVDDRAGRITVAELAGSWRQSQLHMDTTEVRVEHALRLHVLPGLGRQQIQDVRPSHIQAWVRDRSGELAPSTVPVVHTYVASMFALAVRDRLIAASPCDGLSGCRRSTGGVGYCRRRSRCTGSPS